jgi:hypothetical protein
VRKHPGDKSIRDSPDDAGSPQLLDVSVEVIRPGGEKRLSNFLTWQVADAWLVFSDEMWPEFSRESFEAAIKSYQEAEARRARRRPGVASTNGKLDPIRLSRIKGSSRTA